MIIGVGLDVCELDRIAQGLGKFGERYLDRILTQGEKNAIPRKNPVPYLAARFAAKEAAVKALGTGFSSGVHLHTLEVTSDELGKPAMTFHGAAAERYRELGATRSHLSLTHGRDVAAAVVILETD